MRAKPAPKATLLVLASAIAVDLLLGEPPPRLHPVTWIGCAIDRLEAAAPAQGRARQLLYGAASTIAAAVLIFAAARWIERAIARLPFPLRLAATALLLKPAFALRMLLDSAATVETKLLDSDLDGARSALSALVSRNTSSLCAADCAAAAIESLAENSCDSIFGPWLAFSVFGLPGAWIFRAINTFDSRWGYHGRYEWLGRVAAKLDDAVCWVPARVSAILLIAAMPFVHGNIAGAMRTLVRDRCRTESPNAGWTMSAMAGGLGMRLDKRGHYELNRQGQSPSAAGIRRARGAVLAAGLSALAVSAALPRWNPLRTTGKNH